MKKLTLLSASIITLGILTTGSNFVYGQDKKLTFGINVGAGLPMGAYSKNDSTALPLSASTVNAGKGNDTTKYNGFAKTGFHFSVYGQYMIAGPIGVKLVIGGTMNSYDAATFSSNYGAIEARNTGNSQVVAPLWTASGSYYIGQYLVGPCLKLPAGDKLRIEAQVLVGLVMGNYPSLTGTESGSGTGYSYTGMETYSTVSASGFGYNVGAGIEYMVTSIIGIHLNVGYTGSSFSYSNYTISSSYTETITGGSTVTSTSPSQTYNIPKTMSMGLLQVTVGGSIDL